MTKIDIISGFLGAGKTTLIKKLLKEALDGEQVVLIENEFGEIGIDGGFLKEAGVQITEMNSGCICCSLVGDFGTALQQVIRDYHPDRVVIEPSGVGKLSDVIRAVMNVSEDVEMELNSYTAVVDGQKCKMYMKNFGEFFNNQIESAKTIVLRRTQKLSEEKLEACVNLLREHNREATIITTPWDDMDGKKILAAMEEPNNFTLALLEEEEICPSCGHHHGEGEECHEHHHDHDHHHHHADEVFTSWGRETARKFDRDTMDMILDVLSHTDDYGTILRAKGIVPDTKGGWIYFDLVPGEYELRDGEADVTGRLCVIGSELKEDQLESLFGLK